MKLWVGVTDKAWFEYLALQRPDEVNFWQPSGSRNFRVLQPGEPFLFKLHSPDNFIVGGGFFVRYSALPASLAWDAFSRKNGVETFDILLKRVRKYRRSDDALDPIIGCNVLAEPFFRGIYGFQYHQVGHRILCKVAATMPPETARRYGKPFWRRRNWVAGSSRQPTRLQGQVLDSAWSTLRGRAWARAPSEY